MYLGSEGQIQGLIVNIHRRHSRRDILEARRAMAAVGSDIKAAANIFVKRNKTRIRCGYEIIQPVIKFLF